MRVGIPEFENKKALYKYLIENKSLLIDQKKSMPITSDTVSCKTLSLGDTIKTKENTAVSEDVNVLRVKTVANTANWVDSHMDVLLPDSAKKSISERKNIIPHLHDHVHQLDAKVGEVVDITLQNLTFSELGIKGVGTTQAIVFLTDIYKSYNEKVFNQYKQGSINQHSIGLQYVKLDLAINDEEEKEEFAIWEKYYDSIINKDAVDNRGYFWVVPEIKLIENSAVLFGANSITPTLDNNVKNEPLKDTHETDNEPLKDTHRNLKKYLL